jgi:hypothetical protein
MGSQTARVRIAENLRRSLTELESGGTAGSLSSELAAGHEVINHQGSSRKEPGSRVVSRGRGRKTSKSEAAVPIGNHYLSRPKGEMTGTESHWSSYVQLFTLLGGDFLEINCIA